MRTVYKTDVYNDIVFEYDTQQECMLMEHLMQQPRTLRYADLDDIVRIICKEFLVMARPHLVGALKDNALTPMDKERHTRDEAIRPFRSYESNQAKPFNPSIRPSQDWKDPTSRNCCEDTRDK